MRGDRFTVSAAAPFAPSFGPQRSASCTAGISYNGPQNLAQCGAHVRQLPSAAAKRSHVALRAAGHLICHRGGNPTYAFDMCLWGPVTHSSDGGCKWLAMALFAQPRSQRRLASDDFSQTVIAATGDHEVGDSAQTITSDPELLCQTADADAVTCRREHIASDGSGGGWIWV